MVAFGIITGIASLLGLAFSIGAFVQAGRASVAAKQALAGVLTRTLADEFELGCVRMDQLLDFIEHDRQIEAAIRARDLTSFLSDVYSRRSSFLDEGQRNGILNIRTQVQIIEDEIYKNARQPFAPERKERVVRTCRGCSVTLREYLGTMRGRIDQGGRQ